MAVRKGLKDLKYNKDKIASLRDNIQIHYLSMGRSDAQKNWSENRKQKTIPQLTDMFIEIIKMFKNVPVPDDPNTTMPQRKQQPVVDTLNHKARQLNREKEGKLEEFNMGCLKEWERRDVSGEAATSQNLQALGKHKLDKSCIKKRIRYSAYYDVDGEGKEKKLQWVGGLRLDVSDGTWLIPGARTRCYAENEATSVLWDEVQEAEY